MKSSSPPPQSTQGLSVEVNQHVRDTDARIELEKQDHSRDARSGATAPGIPLFGRPFLVIAATAFAVVVPSLFLGVLAGHDFTFHMNSWMEVLGQWKQGIIYPRWATLAHYGYGEPRFIFYPPASWILGAALGSVLPWNLVPGAYVWLVVTLSGCSMFMLARQWLDRRAATFAALLYAANPYHVVIIYWRSDFSELLAGALLPLLMLFVLRLDQEDGGAGVHLAIVLAAAWLTNAPAAVMASYSLVLLLILVAAFRRSRRVLLAGAISLGLGASLAAAYILPAAYEQGWVKISQVFAEGFRPRDNFLFTSIASSGHDAFNRLLSMVSLCEIIVVAAAVWYSRRRYRAHHDAYCALTAWAGTSALLMVSVTSELWNYLPLLHFLQFPWRWLLCLNVAFALLVATAWQSRLIRVGICVGMLGVLIFGAARIQRPWKATGTQIGLMADRQSSGQGYKSRPEYVPTGANVDSIDEKAPQVNLEVKADGRVDVQRWEAESKVFSVNVAVPNKMVLRLFNYPAWRVMVNGRRIEAETQLVTGKMMIPVQAGKSDVRISFARTWDRTAGGVISAVAFLTLVCGSARTRRYVTRQRPTPSNPRVRTI